MEAQNAWTLVKNNEFAEPLVLLNICSPLQVKVARLKPLQEVNGRPLHSS